MYVCDRFCRDKRRWGKHLQLHSLGCHVSGHFGVWAGFPPRITSEPQQDRWGQTCECSDEPNLTWSGLNISCKCVVGGGLSLLSFIASCFCDSVREGWDWWMNKNRKPESGMNCWPWGKLSQNSDNAIMHFKCISDMKYRGASRPTMVNAHLRTRMNTVTFLRSFCQNWKGINVPLRNRVALTCLLNGLCFYFVSLFILHSLDEKDAFRLQSEDIFGKGGQFFWLCFISNLSILTIYFMWSTLLIDSVVLL